MLHLVLGGARSGKSSFAEQVVVQQSAKADIIPIYIATAQPLDNEMQQRIAHHQALRVRQNWQLIECPLALTTTLTELAPNAHVLIDCMTLWLSNQLSAVVSQLDSQEREPFDNNQKINELLHAKVAELIECLKQLCGNITIVSNEIGLGVVPMGMEIRVFVDHQGWLNQQLANIADQVTLVTAGLPMTLKGNAHG
ncbi:bifunctional adenosylcobinamide kinase/adenosylcobinamide-phosphate guanylyltransferase [Thalassotalea sp. G2M2-11]|uniref:bifunctional adenosylcobinamide kinase/adenosylcobinamide-phosphate guanylyltransferase n=1 Tax=Thalassotalea sp. G2M2-11 TaxID=2787627 RepID=UPI0019D31454|nr:bifunctional adenosylcobinamide kinase/adenosylcobinamide-phosphate guanylyltransferase [Thalassotalea sp. G2M2-11]